MKRFIAVQVGARRNYAIPSILAQAGLLDSFYTDVCSDAGLGKFVAKHSPNLFKRGPLLQLTKRCVPENIGDKTYTFDMPALFYSVRQTLFKTNRTKQHKALVRFNREFSRAMIRRGVGQATHIYSMFGEGTEFLLYAKNQGLKIVTEIYLSPLTHQIVQSERDNWKEIESNFPPAIIEADYKWFNQVCQLTDHFVVPSPFVAQGLKSFGVDISQCSIVPYAVHSGWLTLQNRPTRGRILFVGTAGLRKGIHILGMAAERLRHKGYDFRVAGGVSETVRNHQVTQRLSFLGRVPRGRIRQEYAQADVFVLPTLAEGSAEVVYEALAVGIPVVTTEAAGSVVRDGIEGFIVPERDPEALAKRIGELVEDRELHDRMAAAAKERAKAYTWDKYAERLLSVFQALD